MSLAQTRLPGTHGPDASAPARHKSHNSPSQNTWRNTQIAIRGVFLLCRCSNSAQNEIRSAHDPTGNSPVCPPKCYTAVSLYRHSKSVQSDVRIAQRAARPNSVPERARATRADQRGAINARRDAAHALAATQQARSQIQTYRRTACQHLKVRTR